VAVGKIISLGIKGLYLTANRHGQLGRLLAPRHRLARSQFGGHRLQPKGTNFCGVVRREPDHVGAMRVQDHQ
jgi:hypothetical protein